jgi:hypothetical protein
MNQKNKNLNVVAEWHKAQTAHKEAEILLAEEMPEGCPTKDFPWSTARPLPADQPAWPYP